MSVRKRIILAIVAVVFFMSMGTAGYVIIDDYSVLDALYMTVITLTTVGFGEVHPLSDAGRVFTIFLILLGVGGLAFGLGAVTEIILDRATDPKRKVLNMEKRITKLTNHTIICGYGRVGSIVANQLQKAGKPFVVLENLDENFKILEELGYCYLGGDATSETIIKKAGVKNASSFLALLGSDPENLFAVLTARELNPTLKIISRSNNFGSQKRILRAGADSTISPFESAGELVAKQILDDDLQVQDKEEFSSSAPEWIDIENNPELIDKTILETEQLTNNKVIGIRNSGKDQLLPEPKHTISKRDHLLVVAKPQKAESQEEDKQTLVLIDDNPVICTLYTRLFQKAGFIVSVARTGQEGVDLAIKTNPDTVIVDYHLPDIDGIEVTKAIKAQKGNEDLKVFLFTADEDLSNKEEAYAAGVSTIVVKSPDANEIVAQVKAGLNENSSDKIV